MSMFWFDLIVKIFRVLHSDESPKALAFGFALGSIMGLTPLLSAHNLIVFGVILLLNVSISAALFALFVFSAFAYFFDPLFHSVGYLLLVNLEFLKPAWTFLYNIPVAPLFRLNNTVVLGSLVISLLTFAPVYFGFQKAVHLYKMHVRAKVEKWKLLKAMKASGIFKLYHKIRTMGV